MSGILGLHHHKKNTHTNKAIGAHKYQYRGFSLFRATCHMAIKPCVPNSTRVITAFMVAINLAIMSVIFKVFNMWMLLFRLEIFPHYMLFNMNNR